PARRRAGRRTGSRARGGRRPRPPRRRRAQASSSRPSGRWTGASWRQHGGELLVPAAGEADEEPVGVVLERPRERVRRLERGDDPLALGQKMERGQRLLVGCREVLGAAGVPEKRVLGADAGVV